MSYQNAPAPYPQQPPPYGAAGQYNQGPYGPPAGAYNGPYPPNGPPAGAYNPAGQYPPTPTYQQPTTTV